jgi:hypothetical protein
VVSPAGKRPRQCSYAGGAVAITCASTSPGRMYLCPLLLRPVAGPGLWRFPRGRRGIAWRQGLPETPVGEAEESG